MKSIRCWASSQNWLVLSVLILITIAASAPIYSYRINHAVDSDYGSHIRFAQEFLQTRQLEPATLSHPVLQLLLAFLYWASRCKFGLYPALTVVQITVQVFTVLILYQWMGTSPRRHWDWLRAGAAFTLTFVAPVILLAAVDGQFYFGYISLANYHNPTIHMLKPLALLSLFYAIKSIGGEDSPVWGVILAALWMVAATWTKPNYALVMLPAMVFAWLVRVLQKRSVDRRMIVFGFILPAVLTLSLQWLIAYVYGDPGEKIILAPFLVEEAFSDWLLIKFLFSSLFPLVILFFARRELLNHSAWLIGLGVFGMGAAQKYLLAEGGARLYHANFRWSAQIASFILFAIAVRWFLHQLQSEQRLLRWQWLSATLVYAAHFASGIAYYIHCMVSAQYG